jgi:hypothetical protein
VRGDIKKPRQYECHWKSGDDHQHDDSLRQRRHFEDRKDLRDNLHDQPARHRIGGTNFIDMAPLQLGKKVLWIHSADFGRNAPDGNTLSGYA